MGLASKELINSDLGNGFVPKTISEFLQEVSVIEDGKKLAKINGYVFELEQEMKKITVFKRELPVCMLLLGDAIDKLKEEVLRCKERTMKAMAKEEFSPSGDANEKINWMSSVQLWTTPIEKNNNFGCAKIQDPLTLHKNSWNNQECENGICKISQIEPGNVKNRGAVFGLSLSPPVGKVQYDEPNSCRPIFRPSPQKQQEQFPQPKKPRRSWSPDLHRRFVNALSKLGGAQEATPKQIRELMQVADLTNDEVKSHLQKYRLHVRRLASYHGVRSVDLNLNSSHKFKMAQSSSSPEGPLNLGGSFKGVSVSLSMEEEEGPKSESYNRKGRARSR